MIKRALGVNSGRFVSRIRDGDRTRCGESARATRHGFSHSSGGRRQREESAESGGAIRSRLARRSKFWGQKPAFFAFDGSGYGLSHAVSWRET